MIYALGIDCVVLVMGGMSGGHWFFDQIYVHITTTGQVGRLRLLGVTVLSTSASAVVKHMIYLLQWLSKLR